MKILPEQKTDARCQMTEGHPHPANPSAAQSSPKRTPLDGSRPSIGHRSGSLPLHPSKIKPTTARRRQTRSSRSLPKPTAAGTALSRRYAPLPRSRHLAVPRSRGATRRCRARGTLRCLGGGGGERNRTDDLLLAKQALSQLSYTPKALGEAQSPRTQLRRNAWWAREDLNLRPHAYQARALTN